MVTKIIEELLKNIIGLDSASIGPATISRSVRRRMLECTLSDEKSYVELLKTSSIEMQALIDEVTVPETWFFRGIEPFRLLAEYASREWMGSHPGKFFRVLSAPCSSGEEPYSIAMVLMDIGLQKNQFHIDAIDINTRSIDRAKLGLYGRNSFRGDEGDAMNRYFQTVTNGYEINKDVRDPVNFIHGNIMDKDFLCGMEVYDAIFCRNLLIYFDRYTQADVLKKLHGLLAPQGMFFIGHAESGCVDSTLFSIVRQERTFAYRKCVKPQEISIVVSSGGKVESKSKRKNNIKPIAYQKSASASPAKKVVKNISTETIHHKNDEGYLIKATQLADCGELDEAALLCDKHLELEACSATAYYLLGVIREAQENVLLARELFHKALYLDPKHYQALIHLAEHAERQGDLGAAVTYRARARRLAENDMS